MNGNKDIPRTHLLNKLNPLQINRHQINNSVAKMQYSFSKEKRFHQMQKPNLPYYHLPEVKSRRSTTFGEGERSQLKLLNNSPPPSQYINTHIFTNSNAFSFGLSRQKIKNNSYIHNSITPGPGNYIQLPQENSQNGYTIGKSLKIEFLKKQLQQIPGPNRYDLNLLNDHGKVVLSKFSNIYVPKISPPSHKLKTQCTPSPTKYVPETWTNGNSPLGKQKRKGFSFGTSKRREIIKTQQIPGPGNQYTLFNNFSQSFSEFIP